jgi:23S rRNA (adenine1618-N6)-methyltransferase
LNTTKTITGFHPKNKHHGKYDFKTLIQSNPDLTSFVVVNEFGTETIDFANPDAVKMLNKALLLYFYGLKNWDIPKGFLCPPIPGRDNNLKPLLSHLKKVKATYQITEMKHGNKVSRILFWTFKEEK